MKELEDYSTEEILEELERRDKEPIPQIKTDIDWSGVIAQAQGRVQEIVNGTYHEDNDDDVYMFEAVMEAVYGEDYFDWQNRHTP